MGDVAPTSLEAASYHLRPASPDMACRRPVAVRVGPLGATCAFNSPAA